MEPDRRNRAVSARCRLGKMSPVMFLTAARQASLWISL
jgi:hypothetical protein